MDWREKQQQIKELGQPPADHYGETFFLRAEWADSKQAWHEALACWDISRTNEGALNLLHEMPDEWGTRVQAILGNPIMTLTESWPDPDTNRLRINKSRTWYEFPPERTG
jgi:hypothetical protein